MTLGAIRFAQPLGLVLAALVATLVMGLAAHDYARRAVLAHQLGDLPILRRMIASLSPGRRVAKTVLAGFALVLIALAAARPQVAGRRRVELRGLDLVVAMDVSKSMLVDDVEPTAAMAAHHDQTRLGRARELADAVVDQLDGDRVAPVVFAGAASHFPLTDDLVVAAHFLGDIGPADLPQGSNLAEVFRVSRCLLRPDVYDDLGCAGISRLGRGGNPLPGESLDPAPGSAPGTARPGRGSSSRGAYDDDLATSARGKAILIFTDGGDATPEAQREVGLARELGIAVVIVGVGSRAGGLVHEIDSSGRRTDRIKRGPNDTTILSRRDDEGMTALVDEAGDTRRYLPEAGKGEVDPAPIVAALRRVDRGTSVKTVDEMRDVYQPLLFAALMLLLIEAAIGTRKRRPPPVMT